MTQHDDQDGKLPEVPPIENEATISSDGVELPSATISVSSSASSPAEDHAGSQPVAIAGYRIIRELGRGGMGVVWEAEQERPRRRVALKVMRRDHQVDELHARMFQREAETLARLKHPNIAAIYASGHTDDGFDYFAMELVSGRTLDRWLRSRPQVIDADELKLRLRLFRTICDAVHYAHQRGVIHRDLKPANIVVSDEAVSVGGSAQSTAGPVVKILDFGLARITDSDIAATTVSEIGMIKGTLQYMSPEQARGEVETIDVRCDVYALGIILYELLAGKRPYDVSRSAIAEAVRVICEEPPRPLKESWSGTGRLDPDLQTIIGKALEKDMDRRYSSAAALGEDVERHMASQPIMARPPSAAYQMRKFAARNRALVGGAAATLLALIAGVVVSTTLGLREAEQRREAEKARTDLEAVVDFQSRMLASVDPEQMGRAMLADLRERIVGNGETDTAGAAFDQLTQKVNATDAALAVIDTQILERAAKTIDSEFENRPEIGIQLRSTIVTTYGELGSARPGRCAGGGRLRRRRPGVRSGGPEDAGGRTKARGRADVPRQGRRGGISRRLGVRDRAQGSRRKGPEDPSFAAAARDAAGAAGPRGGGRTGLRGGSGRPERAPRRRGRRHDGDHELLGRALPQRRTRRRSRGADARTDRYLEPEVRRREPENPDLPPQPGLGLQGHGALRRGRRTQPRPSRGQNASPRRRPPGNASHQEQPRREPTTSSAVWTRRWRSRPST